MVTDKIELLASTEVSYTVGLLGAETKNPALATEVRFQEIERRILAIEDALRAKAGAA